MKQKKHEKLMLVDNPSLLFKILCEVKDSTVTIHSFKQQMEKTMKRKKPIHIKTAHTYFYTATTYGLLNEVEDQLGLYRLSETGKYFCKLIMDPQKKGEYAKSLRALLLSNPKKGALFREFTKFVEGTRSEKEVYVEFQPPTGKTLIAWGLEAKLIFRKGNFIAPIKENKKPPYSLEEFWEELLLVYDRIQQSNIGGLKSLPVEIQELRRRVSSSLYFEELEEFDTYLRKILETKKKRLVILYGAPSHLLEDEDKTFNQNGMIYAYISLSRN